MAACQAGTRGVDYFAMFDVDREFLRRAARIPRQGLGLSVDVYQPDLAELVAALEREGLAFDYLELFKAPAPALEAVRRRLPSPPMQYHGEGLWLTQPDWDTRYPWRAEVETAATHLRLLGSDWITHECAAKQMAGYSFGTYLPPLFTGPAAEVTAGHVRRLQERLDRLAPRTEAGGPLILIEIPPLTYVGFGDLDAASFFRRLVELVPCGLVLDLGHVWSHYRYTGAWRDRPLRDYFDGFLDDFPLDRVIQVHLAGLAVHERDHEGDRVTPPRWLDAHAAPVPEALFEMLAQTLARPQLRHLKGVALEVDTKPIPQTVAEFRRLLTEFGRWAERPEPAPATEGRAGGVAAGGGRPAEERALAAEYLAYVRTMTGAAGVGPSSSAGDRAELDTYRRLYLPHEILVWGGDLREMFPETCRRLDDAGIPLDRFVGYWCREPRPVTEPYDFFLLKVGRFAEFVEEVLPGAAATAGREAEDLRAAYRAACEPADLSHE